MAELTKVFTVFRWVAGRWQFFATIRELSHKRVWAIVHGYIPYETVAIFEGDWP